MTPARLAPYGIPVVGFGVACVHELSGCSECVCIHARASVCVYACLPRVRRRVLTGDQSRARPGGREGNLKLVGVLVETNCVFGQLLWTS